MKKANIDLFVEIEVKNKKGKTVYKKRFRSKSWVKNFVEILRSQFANEDATVKATDGNDYILSVDYIFVKASEGEDTFGIQVGSGTTSPTPNDYILDNKINHGTGAGELRYGNVTVETVSVTDTNVSQFRVIRVFTNDSGGSVDVNEIGLVASFSGYYVLIARDVLASTVTLADGETLTVRYIVKVTT